MASTYVNDLRLEEMATGDQSGTWGDTTNTNLELIAEAFSYGTEASFGSDADATTTIADGASDPVRSLYLKVTSSVSLTATRTLTIAPNTVSKIWIIENATSGSQSINISQGSGANVTIPNGDVKVIYTDGAGAGAAVVDAFTDLNLSGTTTVAALDAGSGAITTTGTVTGGTLAGTLSTAAQPNITSLGTLTGLDVAGTPTFDGLTVDGEGRIEETGAAARFIVSRTDALNTAATASVDLLEGSAGGSFGSANNYGFSIDLDGSTNTLNILSGNQTTITKRLSVARDTGDISFYDDTGTSQALYWDASAESLGIGTTSPEHPLHVNGGTANTVAQFQSTDANAYIEFLDSDAGASGCFIGGAGDDFVVLPNASEKFRVTSSGNVGIGTDSPDTLLHLSDTSGNSILRLERNDTSIAVSDVYGSIEFEGQDASSGSSGVRGSISGIAESTTGGMGIAFSTAPSGGSNTEVMRIDRSGNVGIGTDSPDKTLHIVGDDGVTTFSGYGSRDFLVLENNQNCNFQIISNSANAGNILFSDEAASGRGILKYDHASDFMSFTTASAEAMRIDSSGNVGIGTSPTYRLDVTNNSSGIQGRLSSSSSSGTSLAFQNSATNGRNYRIGSNFVTGAGEFSIYDDTASAERMRIDSSGNVGIGTTSLGGAAGPRLAVDNTNNVSGDAGIYSYLGANCSNTSSAAFSALISGVGNKFYVYGNGDVVNTNNSYGAISDIKFKENIVDATPKLKDVLRLKVRNFNLKTEPNSKQIGFIAQEFEEVFPAMINVSPDTDVNGETLETTHKSIKLSVLVPILVKAIQEQQTLIEQLQAEVALLKGE